jgi:hypothetical protein
MTSSKTLDVGPTAGHATACVDHVPGELTMGVLARHVEGKHGPKPLVATLVSSRWPRLRFRLESSTADSIVKISLADGKSTMLATGQSQPFQLAVDTTRNRHGRERAIEIVRRIDN